MNTIDTWEAELGKIDFNIVEQRFLVLIDLVRKKDQFLKICSTQRYPINHPLAAQAELTTYAQLALEALALTEELK